MPDISLVRVDEKAEVPRLNVVFIHGLGGNPTDYWCHEGGQDGSYFWLRGIAEDVPGTAVWTLGYPADKTSWGTGWPIAEAATAILDKLMSSQEFRATGDVPVAFVCHSLGGIIVKKLVVTAHLDRAQQPTKGKFLDRIAGVVFLATPHGGSILASIASAAHWFVSKTMNDLTASNALLLDLSNTYRDRIANGEALIRHRVYFEGIGVWGTKAVSPVSADPGLPGVRPIKVDRDHLRIQKPIDKTDVVYEGILAFLKDEVLQPRVLSTSQKLDEILRWTARSESVPLDALRTILSDMGETAETLDFGLVGEKLKAKAAEFNVLTERLNRLSNDDPEVSRLRQAAAEDLAKNRFLQADSKLAGAEARDLEGLKDLKEMANKKRLSAAESRAERAAAAKLRLSPDSYRDAASHFGEAARIAQAADPNVAYNYACQQGLVLIDLGDEFGLNSALVEAIEHFRAILAGGNWKIDRLSWATTQSHLGNALRILGERERESGTARLEEAAAAFRAALQENRRDSVPLRWAATQHILGNVLVRLGERESGTVRLKEATEVFRLALTERKQERVPLDWAATQNNLGHALRRIGERESGTARLEEAVDAFRLALKERRQERVPLEWAGTQLNLGSALLTLEARESGTVRLEEAVDAFRAALQENRRDRVPLRWAMTQNNLGSTLRMIGERESGTARLEEAVDAYRLALEERRQERVPLDWATTQNNLGNALATLGEREKDAARLEEAVDAFRAALQENRRDLVPLRWAATQHNLGKALHNLGQLETGTSRLEEAVYTLRLAMEERRQDRVPLEWAATQTVLGNALRILGEREISMARLEEAVAAFQAALQENRRDRVPLYWAGTVCYEGVLLHIIAERRHDVSLASKALRQINAALEVFAAAGLDSYSAYCAEHAELVQKLIETLRGER